MKTIILYWNKTRTFRAVICFFGSMTLVIYMLLIFAQGAIIMGMKAQRLDLVCAKYVKGEVKGALDYACGKVEL